MSILLRINRKSPPGLFTLLTVVNKETGRKTKRLVGGYSMEAPPLPIPNREVKLHSADGTAVWWESRSLPTPHNLGPFICLNGPLFVYIGHKKWFTKCKPFLYWIAFLFPRP